MTFLLFILKKNQICSYESGRVKDFDIVFGEELRTYKHTKPEVSLSLIKSVECQKSTFVKSLWIVFIPFWLTADISIGLRIHIPIVMNEYCDRSVIPFPISAFRT